MGHGIGEELGLGEGKVAGLTRLIGRRMSRAAEDDLLMVQHEGKIWIEEEAQYGVSARPGSGSAEQTTMLISLGACQHGWPG
jgi:hypothetical protein